MTIGARIDDLRDRACHVTGASTGIGAAVARALAAQGARVAAHYGSNREAAETLAAEAGAAGGEIVVVQRDLSDGRAAGPLVEEAAERLGGLDVLINNAGSPLGRVPIANASDAFYDQVMDLNFRAVFVACRAAVGIMRRQGGGAIVNTTSIAARHGGGPGALLYAAAKSAVSSLTRGLAKELAREDIRVNAVAPGVIATPLHDRLTPPDVMQGFLAAIPMNRAGVPDECVGAYLFLASPSLSGYMTGQIIEVNGGQYMP
jgi:3-oxoacyl-[acyl-carrier protein] reductase